jgi:succinate dehydrogenase hydrophobic membrane anchor protein
MNNPYAEVPRQTAAWLWQAFTGVCLVILLGLHFIANHFIVKTGLRDYSQVVAYLRNPVILCLEILFLLCVTTHALLGVRSILLDFGLSESTERRLDQILKFVGVLTVGYGLGLTWMIIR